MGTKTVGTAAIMLIGTGIVEAPGATGGGEETLGVRSLMGVLGFPCEGDSNEGGKTFLGSGLPLRKWYCLHSLLGSTSSRFLHAAYHGTSSKVPPHAGHKHNHTVQGASGALVFKGAGPSAGRMSHMDMDGGWYTSRPCMLMSVTLAFFFL